MTNTKKFRKSIFSYHKVINNTLYLYNSLKGIKSLVKIINPYIIADINQMIESENYDDGSPHIIELLKEIEFIKLENEDEEKHQREIKMAKIDNDEDLFLTIIPTTNCNFKCVYCYEEYNPLTINEAMQQNIVNFVMNKIKKCRNLYVSWFGGEPLLALDKIKALSNEFIKIANSQKKPTWHP